MWSVVHGIGPCIGHTTNGRPDGNNLAGPEHQPITSAIRYVHAIQGPSYAAASTSSYADDTVVHGSITLLLCCMIAETLHIRTRHIVIRYPPCIAFYPSRGCCS